MAETRTQAETTLARLIQAAATPDGSADEHRKAWSLWLTFSPEQQSSAMQRLLAASGESPLGAMPELYTRMTAPGFVPASAAPAERDLFAASLELALGHLLGSAVHCALCGKPDCDGAPMAVCAA